MLRHLGYLYISFAHLSDFDLRPEEIATAIDRLDQYIPEESALNSAVLISDVIHWYNASADSRLQVLNSIAVTFNFELPDRELKKHILEDLIEIGKADHNFIESEKEMIRVLSKVWNVPLASVE
jgi:hypothetical protein